MAWGSVKLWDNFTSCRGHLVSDDRRGFCRVTWNGAASSRVQFMNSLKRVRNARNDLILHLE